MNRGVRHDLPHRSWVNPRLQKQKKADVEAITVLSLDCGALDSKHEQSNKAPEQDQRNPSSRRCSIAEPFAPHFLETKWIMARFAFMPRLKPCVSNERQMSDDVFRNRTPSWQDRNEPNVDMKH